MSKLSAVVLISLLLSCLSIFPIANASAQPCGATWDITGTSGIKSNYQLGEDINGSISFRINNPSDCPGCFLQILVGLVDSQNTVIDVKCIYDGQPKVCPEWTVDTVNVSWEHPSSPGNYRLLATLDSMYSCSDAKPRFRPQESYKHIATITVSASETDKESVAPATSPSPPPTEGDTTTGSSGSGTTPDGGAPTIGSNTLLIIVAIALLVLLFIFSLMGSKALKGFFRFILVLAVVSLLGYLLWMYGIPAITNWFRENLSTIIGVLLLLGVLAIAGTAIWKNWNRISDWIEKTSPNPEKEGYIYIAHCPSHEEDLYKIGRSKDHPRKRIKDIGGTGVPEDFILIDHWKVADVVRAESLIHKALAKYRTNPKREFFKARLRIISRIIEEEIKDISIETDT